ncbi:MAG: hypothetical protein M1296_02685 [Chloroflexi bacterium]|nr:hypothetical protein [Chloroflexota bacterium]
MVTEGTTHRDAHLLRAVIAGLSEVQRDVLVLTGAPAPVLPQAPAHITIVDYVPYRLALRGAAAFVTNGGAGSVTAAIAAGVPLIVVPAALDKYETARRVAWAKIGVALPDIRHVAPDAIRRAVGTVTRSSTISRAVASAQRAGQAGGGANAAAVALMRLLEDRS